MTKTWSRVITCALVASVGCTQPGVRMSAAERAADGYVEAVDGTRLFYRVLGSGQDTVVVIHGGPGFTMDYLYADLEPLASDYTLVFYDQRGTGRSTLVTDSAALGADAFVTDLESIRQHFGMEKLVLLGHSWGAGLAALYAQQHADRVARMLIVGALPLQRSVLMDGFRAMAAGRDTAAHRRMAELMTARQADPGDATACREYYTIWFEPFVADPHVLTRSKGDFCAGTPASLRNKMSSVDRYTMASLGDWDFRPAMRSNDTPTLVIHGTLDPLPLEGARDWSRTMRNARILELVGVGHFPYLESPELFFSAVREFMGGEWPEGARVVPD